MNEQTQGLVFIAGANSIFLRWKIIDRQAMLKPDKRQNGLVRKFRY